MVQRLLPPVGIRRSVTVTKIASIFKLTNKTAYLLVSINQVLVNIVTYTIKHQ